MSAVRDTKLAREDVLQLKFTENTCSRCTVKIKEGNKIVTHPDEMVTLYANSDCHPIFVPKYSVKEKIIGGCKHVATLGVVYIFSWYTGRETWPTFMNDHEVCAACGEAPGTLGCRRVFTEYKCKKDGEMKTIKVEHLSDL